VGILGEKLLKISAFGAGFLGADKKFFLFSVNVIQISLRNKILLNKKSVA
jgi:hypothetical protein